MSNSAGALLRFGKQLARDNKRWIAFTGMQAADAVLNDIVNFPHMFLLGVVSDRQMKAERAWLVPWHASERFGSPSFIIMRKATRRQWQRLLSGPPSLHRFPADIASAAFEALARVEQEYKSDASQIWAGTPSSAAVVSRLLAFEGVGPKLATMAVNLLATRLAVPLSDYYSVDISADVHVRRVLARLGLAPAHSTVEQIVYAARAISPQFPGALDRPAFEIGRQWCRPRNPTCTRCPVSASCPSSQL